jgi:hypothetical protein
MNTSVISDGAFDELVKLLEENWEEVSHPHKSLIDRNMLKSGFYLKYPEIVKYAAIDLLKRKTT